MNRICNCEVSTDSQGRQLLVPERPGSETAVLLVVTYYGSGFPGYRFSVGEGTLSRLLAQSELESYWAYDGLHDRGLSALVKLQAGDLMEVSYEKSVEDGYDGPKWLHWLGLSLPKHKRVQQLLETFTADDNGQKLTRKKAKKEAS